MLDRRTVVSLLASLPLLGHTRALAATAQAQPLVRSIRATPNRNVDVWTWRATTARVGTIAFSHGFGSAPRHYPDFVHAWSGAGYDVVAPLHVDSREHPQAGAFKPAAQWAARIQDMRAVATLIEGHYVAAGHSFGALNALVLGGVAPIRPEGVIGPLADKRIRAVLAFSPPPPSPLLIPEAGYAALARPALIQTGTRDLPSNADPQSWRAHLAAFRRSPTTNDHFALVLEGVDHYFGGLICDPARTGPDQRAALTLATQASLAFLARFGASTTAKPPAKWPAFPTDPKARFYIR